MSQLVEKIGQLKDNAENSLFNVKELQNLGVDQYTPAGMLFLMASHSENASIIEQVTGVAASEIVAQTKDLLVKKYAGQGQLSASDELIPVIDKAIAEAGGSVNTAGPEHVLLALLTVQNATRSDVAPILKKLNITEKIVRERINGVSTLLPDNTASVASVAEAYIDTKTAAHFRQELLARLTRDLKNPGRVLLTGSTGIGKHSLVASIASVSVIGREFKGLNIKKITLLTPDVIGKLEKVSPKDQAAAAELQNVLLVADLDNLDEQTTAKVIKLNINAPILAVSSLMKEVPKNSNHGWESVPMVSYEVKEITDMLKARTKMETDLRKLNLKDPDKIAELLIRYGQTFYPQLALPGNAVELLQLAAADAVLIGMTDLSPQNLADIFQRRGVNLSSESILKGQKEKVKTVMEALNKRVIGQNEAKSVIKRALDIQAAGLGSNKGTIANFYFLGPTGVGKTEIAKALAEALFDSESNLIRIDMSEYQQEHTVSRLFGAPPGYVGYDQGGQLTNAVRSKPFSVILLDEMDKAHPKVMESILQVLDDGRMTDGQGVTVDFRQTIIIMTSNHGSGFIREAIRQKEDLNTMKKQAEAWFENAVPPEFIGRIGRQNIIVFNPTTREDAYKITDLKLQKLVIKPLELQGYKINFDPAVCEAIVSLGFNPELGARPLEGAITTYILGEISAKITNDEIKRGATIKCGVVNGQIVIK